MRDMNALDVRHRPVAPLAHPLDRGLARPDGRPEQIPRPDAERTGARSPGAGRASPRPRRSAVHCRARAAKCEAEDRPCGSWRRCREKRVWTAAGIMRRGTQTKNGAADGNRPLEIALPPDFDRIALQGEEGRERLRAAYPAEADKGGTKSLEAANAADIAIAFERRLRPRLKPSAGPARQGQEQKSVSRRLHWVRTPCAGASPSQACRRRDSRAHRRRARHGRAASP